MKNKLEIISKDGIRLNVWVNVFNKTIRFNSKEVEIQPREFDSPKDYFSDNQYEICLAYGVGKESEREEDIKKLKDISTITVRDKEGWSGNPAACFLYLYFPKNTKIAVANYEQD